MTVKAKWVEKLHKKGRNITVTSVLTGCTQRTIKKHLKTPTAKKDRKPTVRAIEHSNAIKKIEDRIDKVKQLQAMGNSVDAISKVTGYTWRLPKDI